MFTSVNMLCAMRELRAFCIVLSCSVLYSLHCISILNFKGLKLKHQVILYIWTNKYIVKWFASLQEYYLLCGPEINLNTQPIHTQRPQYVFCFHSNKLIYTWHMLDTSSVLECLFLACVLCYNLLHIGFRLLDPLPWHRFRLQLTLAWTEIALKMSLIIAVLRWPNDWVIVCYYLY